MREDGNAAHIGVTIASSADRLTAVTTPAASARNATGAFLSQGLQLEVDVLAGVPAGRYRETSRAISRRPILIADDDEGLRAYLRGCLEGLGFTVAEAPDGEAALARARSDAPVLVIADVRMPRMGGLALRDALAAEAGLAGVPVLLMTGDAALARAPPCLVKPFNTAVLRAHLLALLPGAAP